MNQFAESTALNAVEQLGSDILQKVSEFQIYPEQVLHMQIKIIGMQR